MKLMSASKRKTIRFDIRITSNLMRPYPNFTTVLKF